MKTFYRQYNLESGNEHLTAWLDRQLRVGWRVRLANSEEPEQWWTVTGKGDTLLLKEEIKGSHDSKKWFKNDLPRGRLKGLDVND